MTWLPLRAPESLSGEEAELLGALEHSSPEATAVAELARRGLDVIRRRDRAGWEAWSEEVATAGPRELGRYLASLANEQAALLNALSLPYSNGPTEGHVNRVKLIKEKHVRAGWHRTATQQDPLPNRPAQRTASRGASRELGADSPQSSQSSRSTS